MNEHSNVRTFVYALINNTFMNKKPASGIATAHRIADIINMAPTASFLPKRIAPFQKPLHIYKD